MASLLNLRQTTSTSSRNAQNLNGGESCRFKYQISNSLDICPEHCATLYPAIPRKCLCPRNTKDDCEIDNDCHWSAEGKCIHQMDRLYNALLDKRGKTTGILTTYFYYLAAEIL